MSTLILLTLLVNVVLIQGRTEAGPEHFRPDENTHFDVYASALSKAHYNPWVCDYRAEPGYKCLSCSSALHCYPGNFALLIQCAGLFPFCRNGYCSRFKTEGCVMESDGNAVTMPPITMPPYVQLFLKGNKTAIAPQAPESLDTMHAELSEPISEESAANPATLESDDPNINSGGIIRTTMIAAETRNMANKPKELTRISEQNNS